MRFSNAIVIAGIVIVGVGGCSKPKAPATPAQQPPQIDLGEPAPHEPVAGPVPRRPQPAPGATPPAAPSTDTATDAAPGAASAAELLATLGAATDEDGRVRAIDALADLGQNAKPALEALVKALDADNVRIRWHAARAVGAIGEDAIPVIPKLAGLLLGDADPIVCTQSAAAIRAIRADDGRTEIPEEVAKIYAEAAAAVGKAAAHPDARVRRASLRAVAALVADPAKQAAMIDDSLADADPAVVVESLHSLADLGASAVPMLVESLKDPKARYWAEVALAEIGPDAAPAAGALAAASLAGEPEERLQAMLALAAIGEPAAEAADELAAALDSSDTTVRSAAAFALGRMRAASADGALEKAAADADPFLAGVASWARARIHPDDAALVSTSLGLLTGALEADRPNVKIAALHALPDLAASLDDAQEGALADRFVKLLEDAHPGVRSAAAAALARLGPTAVGSLEGALGNPALRGIAMELLAAAGSSATPAVDTLVASLADAEPGVRGDAAVALASIGAAAAEAVPALVKVVEGGDAEDPSRYPAIYALGKIGPAAAPAAAALKALVAQDADPLSQIVAAWAMLKIEPDNKEQIPAAVPLLRKALRSDREVVRLEAILALADLGADASSAVAMLELMAEDDPLPSIRKAAAEAAAKIKAAR